MSSIETVMVVDGGARGQAMAHKLANEGLDVVVSPGNPGNEDIAESTGVAPIDIEGQLDAAKRYGVDLTVVGGEDPLVAGIKDAFDAEGRKLFGPTARQARIESEKDFAKNFAKRRRIPIGKYKSFSSPQTALEFAEGKDFPFFVKNNEPQQGKGVTKCDTFEQLESALATITRRGVLELNVPGYEASLHTWCDGESHLGIPILLQDHKLLWDKMTGGMGTIGPLPNYTPEEVEALSETFAGDVVATSGFSGMLFSGLKGEKGQEKLLEWNARFGDPEWPLFMRLMKSDLLDPLAACVEGNLKNLTAPEWIMDQAGVCLVLAAEGYPDDPKQGQGAVIEGIKEVMKLEGVDVLHAGTAKQGEDLVVAGGRVLDLVCLADTHKEAIDKIYQAANHITFNDKRPTIHPAVGHSVVLDFDEY